MRRLTVALTLIGALMVPGIACARVRMVGQGKRNVIYGYFTIRPGRHIDQWDPRRLPTSYQERHCFSVFRSTYNRNWAVLYSAHMRDRACRYVSGDGVEILNVERWVGKQDGKINWYWTPVVGFDENPCAIAADQAHYPGESRTPDKVIEDLFGVHCPSESWGTLPGG